MPPRRATCIKRWCPSSATTAPGARPWVRRNWPGCSRTSARMTGACRCRPCLEVVRTVEKHSVNVRIQLQIGRRPLHRHHRSTSPRGLACIVGARASVEGKYRFHKEACQCRQQRAVIPQPFAPRERERQHPLPHIHIWNYIFYQVRRRRTHPATHARWAKSPPLASKRHKPRLFALTAPKPCKPTAQNPALQI